MSTVYFTADMHFSHSNIIDYCNRPFKNYKSMNKTLIKNWNSIVHKDDTVFHVGDFCFANKTSKHKADYYEKKLNGNIIHILGNHDHRGTCKAMINKCIIRIGDITALVQHKPPRNDLEIDSYISCVICGHVHEKWKHIVVTKNGKKIPIINVGVDVWDFKPVKLDALYNYYQNVLRGVV